MSELKERRKDAVKARKLDFTQIQGKQVFSITFISNSKL